MFFAKKIFIQFEFSTELFLLTEIKFGNEIVSEQLTSMLLSVNQTTPCPTGKLSRYLISQKYKRLTLIVSF